MSSNEWKLVKLSDIAEITMGQSPKGEDCNNEGIGEPLLNGPTEFGESHPYPTQFTTNMKKASKKGDVLFCVRGSTAGRMNWADKEYAIGRGIAAISPKVDNTDYFVRACVEFKLPGILKMATGSTFPNISRTMLTDMSLLVPNIDEMKQVNSFIKSIDKKIEVNNQINDNLEKMAQAIFKQWFIDFEFPNEDGEPYKSSNGEMIESELGMIPKEWELGCIGDYVKVKSGFAFKSAWWQENGIPVIKIKDISNNTINFNDISYVSEDKIDSAKDFIVNAGDLVIAMTGATIGKFAIVPPRKSNVLVNQRVGKFFLGENPLNRLGFIYCLLCREEVYNQIVSRGDGSAQPNISPSNIESIKIILPRDEVIIKFNNLVTSIFEKIIRNVEECNKLTDLRDILLPKLMSGEIRV